VTDAGSASPLRLGLPAAQARVLCVLVHGRGGSPEMMEDHVVNRLGAEGVHFALTRAPTGTWYDARAVEPVSERTAMQLEAALDAIDDAIAQAVADGAPGDRVVLGGFSQGACVALEYAMRRPRRLMALAALTGCRVGGLARPELTARLDGLPVYMGSGDADQWIPLDAFFGAAQDVALAGAALTLEVFPGRGHQVSDREIAALDALLASAAAGRSVGRTGKGASA
jgi:phospholipase/carboxylesterase